MSKKKDSMKNVFVFLMFTIFSFGQVKSPYALIDAKMDKIPADLSISTDGIAKFINENFKSENDKIRAAFYWTSSNIRYDIENIASIDFKEVSPDKIKTRCCPRKVSAFIMPRFLMI